MSISKALQKNWCGASVVFVRALHEIVRMQHECYMQQEGGYMHAFGTICMQVPCVQHAGDVDCMFVLHAYMSATSMHPPTCTRHACCMTTDQKTCMLP